MIIKGMWFHVEAGIEGWCIVNDQYLPVVGTNDDCGLYGVLTEAQAKEICVLHNAFRGYDIEEIEKSGIVGIVGNELLKQDEIIQKLIDLVEHYGNCYNHDLTAYHEYRVAKKYMEDKNV